MYKSKKFLELIPTKHSHIFDVKLNLEFQSRYIGKLDTSGQGKFLTNRKAKHLHRITSSLGLNAELITCPDFCFRTIVINYEGQKLITTRQYFLTHSKLYSFQGFEKQYFLPLESFGIQKAEEYERSINNQLGLFGEVA